MAEINTKIFKQEAKFVAGVARIKNFPKLHLPQIAFFGKSNVGKSSLINTICKRKNLARTSHTPGRTQQINFFSIADKFLIADLPGYGFAKVPEAQKLEWEKLIVHYLDSDNNLRLVNLLIDARRGLKDNDIAMIDLLKFYNKNFQIVLTKADKEKVNEEFLSGIKNQLEAIGASCNIIATSSKNGAGAKELQISIVQAL